MRGRGLKLIPSSKPKKRLRSPLMRGRGLKQGILLWRCIGLEVAPHAGAWIETRSAVSAIWIYSVAPHAGAWIETGSNSPTTSFPGRSPLMRGRGLKHYFANPSTSRRKSPLMRGRGLKQPLRRAHGKDRRSPLMRGRGLKHHPRRHAARQDSRPSCGGVD